MLFILLMSAGMSFAQQNPVTKANYDLAERFSLKKVSKYVFSSKVEPHWFRYSDKFWYTYKTGEGIEYYIYDPYKKSRHRIWDMDDLAARISRITEDPFDGKHLPVDDLRLKDDKYFTFTISSSKMIADTTAGKKDEKKHKVFRFRYDISSGKLKDITSQKEIKDFPGWASISPDGRFAVYAKNYNLFYMDTVNLRKATDNPKDSTIIEHRLTSDGRLKFSYNDIYVRLSDEDSSKRKSCNIFWSPDSRHFALVRSNETMIKDLWVINSLKQPRPELESYSYLMPGETGPKTYLYLFDFEHKTYKIVNTKAFKYQYLGVEGARQVNEDNYAKYRSRKWLGNNDHFYITRFSRDIKKVDRCVVNVEHPDSARVVIKERLNTYVETRDLIPVNGGRQLIEWSERDGWAHLYMYNTDGTVRNRITSGNYHVEDVIKTDDSKSVIYFTACGKEKGENPYYTYLYSVHYDGSGLKLLCSGDFDNTVSMSDDGKYFVNNYSRVDCTPKSAVYDNLGNKLSDIETADFRQLLAMGYKFPQIFRVKAGDGITDLYGVMYKPFDFDSTKLYPIIEYVYPGPQTEANNSSWSARMNRIDRLAQLGFIVITVGNRGGHPNRSKWYHNFGYGNLRDYGLEDKKVAVQQLAARYKFIDGNRVGIHGHSGGGFMSTAAILTYPDFFKAAVSCSGNHDNNIYNNWWSEQHNGLTEEITEKGDTTFHFSIKTNEELAKNLKGHLLMITGDVDDNVNPANTYRMADAFIKANKRFDIFIMPGQHHGYGKLREYFFWKMADYFTKNLMGDNTTRPTDIRQMNND